MESSLVMHMMSLKILSPELIFNENRMFAHSYPLTTVFGTSGNGRITETVESPKLQKKTDTLPELQSLPNVSHIIIIAHQGRPCVRQPIPFSKN